MDISLPFEADSVEFIDELVKDGGGLLFLSFQIILNLKLEQMVLGLAFSPIFRESLSSLSPSCYQRCFVAWYCGFKYKRKRDCFRKS